MYKIDLHTHSVASPDGGLGLKQYKYFLDNKLLDYIAITDHNEISYATHAKRELGDKIIVGEEIMTSQGEVIGLFLTTKIPAGMTAAETARLIKEQGGLVYIPHPFETLRSGISLEVLDEIVELVDIVEAVNGRAYLQNRSKRAVQWAQQHKKALAASSDAHGRYGWGYTYSLVQKIPTRDNIVSQLVSASFATKRVGIGVIYPKLNRLTKKIRRPNA